MRAIPNYFFVYSPQPCLMSRIFACFILSIEKRQAIREIDAVSSILPYLKSVVKSEAVSLYGWIAKSVHFCAFDYSSTLPPVDRVQGSGANQEEVIEALRRVKIEIDILSSASKEKKETIKYSLSELLAFLTSPKKTWLEACSQSVSTNYPLPRIERAVAEYSKEISALLSRIAGNQGSLFIEKRLAELVGQALRYQIRLLLLPAPPRLTPADSDYDHRSQSHSQVFNKIVMKTMQKNAPEVTEDRIAALFTKALDYLCEYFGLEQMGDPAFCEPTLPNKFCELPASKHEILKNGGPRALSEKEIEEVCSDIDDAAQVLSARNASVFLKALLSSTSVQEEIQRQGGWTKVETYATYSWMYDLWRLCPEDEHLVPLYDFDGFLRRLKLVVRATEETSLAAEESLDSLAKRFRLNTKSKNLLTQHPEIYTVSEYLKERLAHANIFPSVLEARDC